MKNFGKKANSGYIPFEDDTYGDSFYRGDESDDDDLVDDIEDVEEATATEAKRSAKNASGNNMLKVVAPHSYDDAPGIVRHLMDGYTVVLNIEGMDRTTAMRMIDFLLGALEVLDGDFRPVTKTTLVFSPNAGDVAADFGADGEV